MISFLSEILCIFTIKCKPLGTKIHTHTFSYLPLPVAIRLHGWDGTLRHCWKGQHKLADYCFCSPVVWSWSWQWPSHTITLATQKASGWEVCLKLRGWNRVEAPDNHPPTHKDITRHMNMDVRLYTIEMESRELREDAQILNNHVQVLNHNLSQQNELYFLFPHRKEEQKYI